METSGPVQWGLFRQAWQAEVPPIFSGEKSFLDKGLLFRKPKKRGLVKKENFSNVMVPKNLLREILGGF